jgi:superfamily I DNA and RNA helicase
LVKIIAGDKYDTLPKNENGYSNCFDLIDSSNTVPKYDTIVVDEAQDFDLSMGMTIRCLMKSETESSLYVFYDKNQNLFLQDFEDSFGITSQPFVLRYNIRNTAHIYQCAVEQSNLGEDTLANSLIGFKPEIYKFKNKLQALKMLTNIVNKLAQKELVPIESIVILSDLPQEDTILANESHVGAFEITKERGKKNSILFTTTKDFKGLESDVVIYLCREIKGLPDTLLQKTNRYVAITRARYYLYILKLEIAETLNNG